MLATGTIGSAREFGTIIGFPVEQNILHLRQDVGTLDRGTGHDRQQCARAHQEQQDERQQSTIAQEHDTSLQHAKSVLPDANTIALFGQYSNNKSIRPAFEPRIPNTKDKDQENGGSPSSRATGLQR